MADKRTKQELMIDSALMIARCHMLQSLGDMDRMSGQITVSVQANVLNGEIMDVNLTETKLSKKIPMPRART